MCVCLLVGQWLATMRVHGTLLPDSRRSLRRRMGLLRLDHESLCTNCIFAFTYRVLTGCRSSRWPTTFGSTLKSLCGPFERYFPDDHGHFDNKF